MKYQDFLNEEQLNELGILKNIQGAWKGATDGGGLKGAVSGYRASQAQNQGQQHSDKIVKNLKSEYMKAVGGGEQATYQSLIDFLTSYGLSGLESIPNPSQKSAAPTGNTTTPGGPQPATGPETQQQKQAELKSKLQAGQGMGKQTGTGYKNSRVGVPVQKLVGKNPDGSPKFAVVREDVEGVLNNFQIDNIIKTAVQKNYAKIRAAQQGRSTADAIDVGSPSGSVAGGKSSTNANNVFSNPGKLAGDWAAYLASGGQINKKLRNLIKTMNASLTTTPVQKKPAPAAPATAPGASTEHPADDNPNINLGTNEDLFHSKFLGKTI